MKFKNSLFISVVFFLFFSCTKKNDYYFKKFFKNTISLNQNAINTLDDSIAFVKGNSIGDTLKSYFSANPKVVIFNSYFKTKNSLVVHFYDVTSKLISLDSNGKKLDMIDLTGIKNETVFESDSTIASNLDFYIHIDSNITFLRYHIDKNNLEKVLFRELFRFRYSKGRFIRYSDTLINVISEQKAYFREYFNEKMNKIDTIYNLRLPLNEDSLVLNKSLNATNNDYSFLRIHSNFTPIPDFCNYDDIKPGTFDYYRSIENSKRRNETYCESDFETAPWNFYFIYRELYINETSKYYIMLRHQENNEDHAYLLFSFDSSYIPKNILLLEKSFRKDKFFNFNIDTNAVVKILKYSNGGIEKKEFKKFQLGKNGNITEIIEDEIYE